MEAQPPIKVNMFLFPLSYLLGITFGSTLDSLFHSVLTGALVTVSARPMARRSYPGPVHSKARRIYYHIFTISPIRPVDGPLP